MAKLAVVPPAAATPAATASRTALSKLLAAIAAARQEVEALDARREQLRTRIDCAAAARAELVVAQHRIAAARELTVLQRQLPALVHGIMLEDVANIREQLNVAIATADSLSARLFGLRSLLNDRGATKEANDIPVIHEMRPSETAISAAKDEWHAYAACLVSSPDATMENRT